MEQLEKIYNSGKAYERWISRLLQIWFGEEVTIDNNRFMEGISGVGHELDLYLRFPYGGSLHHVAVECKNHAMPVGKETVAAFDSILRDLNAARKEEEKLFGVIISRNGFKIGAVDYARHRGILLLEIREPSEGEWWNHNWSEREETRSLGMNHLKHPECIQTVSQRIRMAMDLAVITKEGIFPTWRGERNIKDNDAQDLQEPEKRDMGNENWPNLIVLDPVHHIGFWTKIGEKDIQTGSWYG